MNTRSSADRSVTIIEGTQWRRLNATLWAGRRDGLPIGTIERYRRFVATDCDGVAYGYFDTLDDGAHALLCAEHAPRLPEHSSRRGWFDRLAAAVATTGATAVIVTALLWFQS